MNIATIQAIKPLGVPKRAVDKIARVWKQVGVQWRLHILIQGLLALFFIFSQSCLIETYDAQGTHDIENQAMEISNGLINGLNLLMVTRQISDPNNRNLLVRKMSSSPSVKALRVIRADQVSTQFGPGLPGEQYRDAQISGVLNSAKPSITRTISTDGSPVLRVIVPFVVSDNFRGTNCLACHHVSTGSVNGAADISMDLTAHEIQLGRIKGWIWSGMLAFQISLSLLVALFVNVLLKRHVLRPVKQLQTTIEDIHSKGDLSLRVALDGEHPDIDKMANTFNSFISNLELATEEIALLAKVVESSEEAIVITDADRNIVFVNNAFQKITGYLENEVLGKNPRLLKSGLQGDEFYRAMWKQINQQGSWQGEIYNLKKNGQVYPEWQSISAVKNAKGEVTNYVSIFLDISKRKEAEERINRMANYDSLTGLANRALLNDRLTQALLNAQRHQVAPAVIYLDLDNFKDINDGYGHAVGDDLLRNMAERLVACVREGDTVARQGGDEFILLFPDIDGSGGAAMVAEKLLRVLSAPYIIDQQELIVSVSIGIALYPNDGQDVSSLLKNADSAMYIAKQEGRNCYRYFTRQMNDAALRRINLLTKLRNVLSRNELELYYQPQLNIPTGIITGVEALIRWRDINGEFVSPSEFIPIAEQSGLIVPIGKWVLQNACIEARQWHDKGFHVTISVNVSGRQFKEADFDVVVGEVLQTSGLEARYLELEMTEGVLIEQDESVSKMMAKLKAMGIRLAIDDFGTGYSSLSYIKRFPISRIKIDQSFVRDVMHDAEDAAIVDAIIYITHGLKMDVIAEGVETMEQLDFLSSHRCNDVQGYFVGRPVPPGQLLELLNAGPVRATEYVSSSRSGIVH